jgi:hypothetical protein
MIWPMGAEPPVPGLSEMHPLDGPPWDFLGSAVPLSLLLAQNANFSVGISGCSAYPSGVTFTVEMRMRGAPPTAPWVPGKNHPFRRWWPVDGAEIPPDVLRLEVRFADGRRATTVRGDPLPFESEAGPRPVLAFRGGSGTPRTWDAELWLAPLPPPGPLAFVTEWPVAGIEKTVVEVDADVILEAAAQSRELWSAHDPVALTGDSRGESGQSFFTVGDDRKVNAAIKILESRGYVVSPPAPE